MSTADDASTLRRRRPPVVRINLEPNEDASDSAQSSPRAASDSSGAGPTGSPRSESSHGSRSAQSSPRAPSAAGSSPRSFSELRVDIPRGAASPPSPLESFLRSVVEAPATQRPPEIEEDDEEDDDALAVASLRSVARHLRGGMSREDCADELERLAANLARTPLARAARARRKASKMMINGLRRVGKRDKVVFDGVYTDEDSARDVVKWGPWSPTLRRISSSERLVTTPHVGTATEELGRASELRIQTAVGLLDVVIGGLCGLQARVTSIGGVVIGSRSAQEGSPEYVGLGVQYGR